MIDGDSSYANRCRSDRRFGRVGSHSLEFTSGFFTFIGYAYEFELGDPDPMSWLPWAIAFDALVIFVGILGIVAGRLILRRSKTAVTASFSAAGIALVSPIPGYPFFLSSNADTSFFLLIMLAPAIFFGAIYSAIGVFTWKEMAT